MNLLHSTVAPDFAKPSIITSFLLNAVIISNYIFWWFGFGLATSSYIVALFFICFIFGLCLTMRTERRLLIIYVLFISLLLISAGSPGNAWDARSIWLFHAKRILIDNNLFAQLDNYAPFSHNDYPTIIPSLTASLALGLGGWNELFPKVTAVLALLSPLLIINGAISSTTRIMVFMSVLIFVGGDLLINGYMDVLLSVYALGVFVSISRHFFRIDPLNKISQFILILSLSSLASIMVLIKNEGFVIYMVLVVSYVITALIYGRRPALIKVLLASILPVVLVVGWRYACAQFGVDNDLGESNFIGKLLSRATNLSDWILLAKSLPKILIISAIGLMVLACIQIYHLRSISIMVSFAFLFMMLYGSFLIFVYLSTPHPLQWHLSTSINRTTLPIIIVTLGALLLVKNYREAAT